MTRSQIATFITNKLKKTNPDNVADCKGFIDFRYQMIWDNKLWRKSLEIISVDVPGGTSDLVIPSPIKLPVALAWNGGPGLTPSDMESRFRDAVSQFDKTGTPTGFTIRPNQGDRPVVRLVPKPASDNTALVLGKLEFTPLTDDASPLLDGVDQALICFAEGDMLEAFKQYDKATKKYEEANAHLNVMKDLEANQEADASQLTPEVEPPTYSNPFGN